MRERSSRDGDRSSRNAGSDGHQQRRETSQTNCCSICLEEEPLRCPVETNCGHRFCARCILNLWQHDRPQPCKCPLCRREVTLLLGAQNFSANDPIIYGEVLAFNQQMADRQGGLWNKLRDLPVLLQHLRRDTLAAPGHGLPCYNKLFVLAVVLALVIYMLSPIDLIPEVIFGIFGLVDDFVLTVYAVVYSCNYYRNWVVGIGRQFAQH